MTQPGTFQALAREVLRRYHQGHYAEALDLVRPLPTIPTAPPP
jgi:hypothetical protein